MGCTIEEARAFKEAYEQGFKGIAEFKKKGSKMVRDKGYILICEHTGHKIYWWDHKEWVERQKSFTSEFWENYKWIKQSMPDHPLVKEVSTHFKTASKWDRLALNSPTQGTGIAILKLAMTNFYNWIIDNNYFNIVKVCNLVHDEACIEYPQTILDVDKTLVYYMEEAADQLCKSLPIPSEAGVGDHWIH